MADKPPEEQQNLFEKIEDEYLRDKKNHLIWHISPEESGKKFTWQEAIAHAWQAAKTDPDKRLWRLPTVEELSHLVEVDKKTHTVVIAQGLITNDTNWYWTSTPVAGGSALAWVVNFGDGSVFRNAHGDRNCVRLCCSAVSD